MPEQMERFRGAFWAARGRIGDQFAVMLHLRSLYVSKAAIFNDLGTLGAGRKSKSRLNSKGLDR